MKSSLTIHRFSRTVCLTVALLVYLSQVSPTLGQRYLTKGEDAPGLTAQKKLLANPELATFVQPVQVFTPRGSLVSMWSSQGFGVPDNSELMVGLTVGQVYRLKVSNIHRHFESAVYPSIELIDRLYPPQGMKNQFPIQIVITQDDLEKAIQGRMVTKVIYLEDGEVALPYRPIRDDQPWFDIGQSEDTLRVARRMGRPMAIVRIGSRVPTFEEMTTREFDFGSQPVFEMQMPMPNHQHFDMPSQPMFDPPMPDPAAPGPVPLPNNYVPGEIVPQRPAPNEPPIIPGREFDNSTKPNGF